MSRSMVMGLVAAVCVGAPAAWAAPSLPVPVAGTASVLPVQYSPCPPGYKVTSHGGCKLSHYLRHHPYQNPNNYADPPPRYRDGYDRPRPRYYDEGD
ncbi:hypothetical protein [Labrys monachus]|uniref:Uncharacterized protein n=1 Tax=Labrys monachus TaxID=217067 RepID=A0ABU0F772_9HYPH|nr:hypothetical protein [Labrys monachus]MDQ0390286.1 hypothetical protein [Labrys monachus]